MTQKKQLLHSSAPARLRVCASESALATEKQNQRWRFVNRYAHRSNGGIPMFSEERLKERAEKVQL